MRYDINKINHLMDFYKKATILKKINPKKIIKCKYIVNELSITRIIKLFNKVFQFLKKNEKTVLFCEFLNKKPNLLKKKYARSTYFKIKNSACNAFLNYFE